MKKGANTMMEENKFGTHKYCEVCGKIFPVSYEKTTCDACEEEGLFRKARDYIRMFAVSENQLIKDLGIPRSMISRWIREGRIELTGVETKKMTTGGQCTLCGAGIRFGNYCSACMSKMNQNGSGKMYTSKNSSRSGLSRMK